MNFYRRHWYDIGCLLFMALAFTGLWTPRFSHIQVILIIASRRCWFTNMRNTRHRAASRESSTSLCGERQVPERYPLNENQVLITNVFLAYPFYIAAIIWPNLIWLGLAQVFFGLLQLVVHGIVIKVKFKSLYNPGLAALIFLHWPIGIYYIHYVLVRDLASSKDFVGVPWQLCSEPL